MRVLRCTVNKTLKKTGMFDTNVLFGMCLAAEDKHRNPLLCREKKHELPCFVRCFTCVAVGMFVSERRKNRLVL
jgi:hypothetical protein